jgi:hypothetical protein
MLLSFFGQEIIAHAATLFAALNGALFLMHHFRPNPSKIRRLILFSLLSGFLIMIVFYAGFRIAYYGQLSAMVIYDQPSAEELAKLGTLGSYFHHVVIAMHNSIVNRPWYMIWLYQFAELFGYSIGDPFCLAVCFGVLAISAYWVYCSCHPPSVLAKYVFKRPVRLSKKLRIGSVLVILVLLFALMYSLLMLGLNRVLTVLAILGLLFALTFLATGPSVLRSSRYRFELRASNEDAESVKAGQTKVKPLISMKLHSPSETSAISHHRSLNRRFWLFVFVCG